MAPQAQPQMSLDDMASTMAETMDLGLGAGRPLIRQGAHDSMAKGGAALGDMPGARPGTAGAEGGFTPQAGGQVIDAGAARKGEGAPSPAEMVAKAGAYTGDMTTAEPGRQGKKPYTGDEVTMEPKGEVGGGSGEGGNLSTSDAVPRGRKAGQVGVSGGGSTGDGMPTQEDGKTRGRKAGKVGMSKALLDTEIAKAEANLAALHQLAKAGVDVDVDDEEEDARKSLDTVGADELIKALDVLENIGSGAAEPVPQERAAALAKGLDDGTLSSEEMVELSTLMKAFVDDPAPAPAVAPAASAPTTEAGGPLEKSFQEQWAEDPANQETFDASPFLEQFAQQTAAGLDKVQERLSKALEVQTESRRRYDTQLAKSLRFMAVRNLEQENLIKSLTSRLDHVEQTPLPRVGVSGVSSLNKGMEGEVGGGQQLGYDAIGDTLVDMSCTMGKAPCGEDMQRAMAGFEATGDISKSLYGDVMKFRQQNKR